MTLSVELGLTVRVRYTTPHTLGTRSYAADLLTAAATAEGAALSGAGADTVTVERFTIDADSHVDVVVSTGRPTPFGDTVGFAKVHAIVLHAAAGNAATVALVGPASRALSPPFESQAQHIELHPGGGSLDTNGDTGWTVTADESDTIRLENRSASASAAVDLILIGEAA